MGTGFSPYTKPNKGAHDLRNSANTATDVRKIHTLVCETQEQTNNQTTKLQKYRNRKSHPFANQIIFEYYIVSCKLSKWN